MDAFKRGRAERAAFVAAKAAQESAKSTAALARWSAPLSPLEKALAEPQNDTHFNGALFCRARTIRRTPELVTFLRVIDTRATRLLEADYMAALCHLGQLPHVRPIDTWEPRGKGRETLFRSLAEHLLAKYPTPTFFWNALLTNEFHERERFMPFVVHVAAGGSVHDGVKKGLLPVPFTRRMCHDFLQTPSDVPFLRAIRRAEALSCGVDTGRFLDAWMASNAGNILHPIADETFWLSVMDWFSKNPMIDPRQVGPLIDFIRYRHQQDAAFNLKGRTGVSLMRAMEEWHAEMAKTKVTPGRSNTFNPSGFRAGEFDKSRYDETKTTAIEKHIWRFREILSAKDLAAEGRDMHHCVFSYSYSVERGTASIWSMTHETWGGEERCITIEVHNRERRIVQARGKRNRAMTAPERLMLATWASQAGLQLGAYL